MLLIFYSVTACSSNDTEGICGYRQEMTMAGTGIMLALIGMRYAKDKKNKKGPVKQGVNPERKKD